jgi:anaerobic selenocysteine-containing dehydrogenase
MTNHFNRRDFLKIGSVGVAASVLAGCQNPRRYVVLEPYVRPPEEQLSGLATWYASTCRQCPAGCGIIARIMNGRAVKLEGNPEHPLNQGKLCARGQAGLQVLYNPDRLQGPVSQAQRGSRDFQAVSWDEALNTLFTNVQAAGQQVAIWQGSNTSGHLSDLFQRFAGAIKSPPPILFDLYSQYHGYHSLQAASQVLFDQDQLPAYDLSSADLIYSFGADFLGTWLSATRYGLDFGHFRSQPFALRGYLVQFEPRMSNTGAKADRWLPVQPGSEALLAQALVRLIADQGFGPADRVSRAQSLAANVDINQVSAASQVTADDLASLARIFVEAAHPLAIPGSILAGQDAAVEALKAVQALNLVTGGINRPGGLQLWGTSPVQGLESARYSSLSDVQDLIGRMNAGNVQVLLVHGANPVYDLPAKLGFREALAKVPLVVSFAPLVDETAAWADLVLPDRTPLESWGYEVVSPNFGLPVVSSQQPVVEPVYDVRATADVLLTIARSLPEAAKAFPWADEVAYLNDQIAQLPAGAEGGSGTAVLASRFQQHGGWWPASPAAALPVEPTLQKMSPISMPQFQGDEQTYPYYLHIFMTNLLGDGMGASQPWLQGSPDTNTSIAWQTWVELNPETGQRLNLKEGDIVRITSPYGSLEAPVYLYPAIRPDTVAVPLGQGHTDGGRFARDRGSNVFQLVGSQADASSSVLTWSTIRVQITPLGKHMNLATFESTLGVTQGFINQAFPGQ